MKIDTKGIIYLAAPYSSPDSEVMKERFRLTCRAAAKLMAAGITVFSPLANTVPAVELGGLEMDHAQFLQHDKKILHQCSELMLLTLDGWKESVGVRMELAEAVRRRMPIHLVREEDIEQLPYREGLVLHVSKIVMDKTNAAD